jgi:hypothetical protein
MSVYRAITPAPVGQQGPPTRVAASTHRGSLRAARGPLLLATGTALPRNGEAPRKSEPTVASLTRTRVM